MPRPALIEPRLLLESRRRVFEPSVGLCELVQHLAMADFVAITGKMEDRAIEFVDHLHQHFLDPVRIRHGRYLAPQVPGFSAEMHASSIAEFSYPDGRFWVEDLAADRQG